MGHKRSKGKQVYPDVYRMYWRGDMVCVEIYETAEAMHERAGQVGAKIGKNVGAYHVFMVGNRKATYGKCKSVIVLHERRSGAGTLAHEFTHAALAWFGHRKGWNGVLPKRYKRIGWDRQEEQLCGMVGELSRRFWCQWYGRRKK